jgi:hypothetical protein
VFDPVTEIDLIHFEWIPAELIHLGIVVMVVVVLAGVVGIGSMARGIARCNGESLRSVLGSRAALARTGRDGRPLVPPPLARPCARRVGFLGLLAATGLDYGLALLGIKETGAPVPIWYPVRLLGTIAGAALVYGATVLIIDRYRAANRSVKTSSVADWLLLALLWVTAVTGFAIELALYLPSAPTWGYWLFLVHVAVAMELVLLAPFMKLAHAVYRPVALFFVALSRQPVQGG